MSRGLFYRRRKWFDLPGVKKEDIRFELVDNVLRISGERNEQQEEKKKSRYRMERFTGSFSRSFALTPEVKAEQIETEYHDGVLRVAVPKIRSASSTQIKLGEGKSGSFQKLLGAKKVESKKVA